MSGHSPRADFWASIAILAAFAAGVFLAVLAVLALNAVTS